MRSAWIELADVAHRPALVDFHRNRFAIALGAGIAHDDVPVCAQIAVRDLAPEPVQADDRRCATATTCIVRQQEFAEKTGRESAA
jgi:hypothetical protein